MPRSVDLSVVLVSWNTAALTLRALASLPAATAPFAWECICVDNASRDDTVVRVRDRHPDVRVLESEANVGFARAANRALPFLSGRYTCFLNTDARPRDGSLAHVVRWLDAHPLAALASPALVGEDERPLVVGRPEPTRWAMLHETTVLDAVRVGRREARAWRDGVTSDVPRAVHDLVGACLVIRTSWIRSLGGFDPDYFFYWEDTDLCRAVRQRGGGVWLVPDGPPVEHVGGASTPPGGAAYRVAFLTGLVRYARRDLSLPAGDAFAAVTVLGFWWRAWRKWPDLLLRSLSRRMRGRPEDANRSLGDALGWIGVLERHGPALLRCLRRPERTSRAYPSRSR